MNDATKWLDQSSLSHIEAGGKRNGVDCRHRNELRKAAGQTRYSVLSIELALVRISSLTIDTHRRSSEADAVQTLLHSDIVSDPYIRYFAANLVDACADFMSKDLRFDVERNWLAVLISVVVCVTGNDKGVCTAQADGGNPDEHVVR